MKKAENTTAETNLPPPQITKPYRTAYSTQRVRSKLHFDGPGRTKQEFKDECDINLIMARFEKTGILPDVPARVAQYLDASEFDFQASMEFVAQAKSMFEDIPAKIRDQFQNDPAKFVEFVENPVNRSQLTEWGLLATPDASGYLPPTTPAPAQPAQSSQAPAPSPTPTPAASDA